MPERKKDMIKKLHELVDFTSGECRNYYFKPIMTNGYDSQGTYPIDVVIDGNILILGNESIPLKDITSIEFGYYDDKYKNRIDKKYCDSISDVEKYIKEKRISMMDHGCGMISPHSYYFPFFGVDKIGGGFATIETEYATYKIFYPTKKITCEMERE